MKLHNQTITKKLENYHEAELNQKFSPYTFYQTWTLTCTILKIEIPKTKKQQLNDLYQKLIKAKIENNQQKISQILTQFKLQIIEDQKIINQYFEEQKNLPQQEEIKGQIFNKYTLGVLSYEDN